MGFCAFFNIASKHECLWSKIVIPTTTRGKCWRSCPFWCSWIWWFPEVTSVQHHQCAGDNITWKGLLGKGDLFSNCPLRKLAYWKSIILSILNIQIVWGFLAYSSSHYFLCLDSKMKNNISIRNSFYINQEVSLAFTVLAHFPIIDNSIAPPGGL